MVEELSMVIKFHQHSGNPVRDQPNLAHMTSKEKYLRVRLMLQELSELSDAMDDNDVVGTADALCDLLYVVFGTALACGYGAALFDLFCEVHRSNMTKTPVRFSQDGNRVLTKGNNYSPPNLKPILDNLVKLCNDFPK